ncbi:hypothetical protein DFQ26_006608 [Actinomortierella ambigua]|nr:hypothetical protein DFQ26_006608 [Actinomortierella ambigua]
MSPVTAMAMSMAFRRNGVRSAACGFSTSSSVSSNGDAQVPKVVQAQNYPFPLYFHLIPRDSSTNTSTSPAGWAAADGAFSASAKKSLKEQVPVSTYALSFLPTFPKHHRQVVGYHSQKQESASEPFVIRPNRFTENEAFNHVLHEVIQHNLAQDPDVRSVLQLQLEGWTHIPDYRNPAPYGRIPLPEDIFGSVQIVDGEIRPESYQRMPSHRIVSSNGLFVLSDYLHQQLLHHLRNL